MTYEPHPLDRTVYRGVVNDTDAQFLRENIARLPARQQDFAGDLIRAYDNVRGPSPKQSEWISKLADQLRVEPSQSGVPAFGPALDLARVNTMFAEAATHLKHPYALIDSAAGKLRIAPAGQASRYYGQLMVTTAGSYEDRTWLGHITRDGIFSPARSARQGVLAETAVQKALAAFAENPEAVSAAFGSKYGICCFCSRELTDERSVAVGYGPICADHFGLAWGVRPVCEVVEPSTEDKVLASLAAKEETHAAMVDALVGKDGFEVLASGLTVKADLAIGEDGVTLVNPVFAVADRGTITLDLKPVNPTNWVHLAEAIAVTLEHGTPAGRDMARRELREMAAKLQATGVQ